MSTLTKLGKIEIPPRAKAILWDMDGVLIDSLGLDVVVVNDLLKKYFGERVRLSREDIQSIFVYAVPEFWRMILEKVEKDFGVANVQEKYDPVFKEYEKVRQRYPFQLCPGVKEILKAVRTAQLLQAVVSNNPTEQVKEILRNVGIETKFDLVVGNDISVKQKTLAKKPAPDTYLFAAAQLGVSPGDCVVVEDSIIGIEAGKAAGCFVIGVATGGAALSELESMEGTVDRVYRTFVN